MEIYSKMKERIEETNENFYGATNLFQFLHIKICLEKNFLLSVGREILVFFFSSFILLMFFLVHLCQLAHSSLNGLRITYRFPFFFFFLFIRIHRARCALCIFLPISISVRLLIPANKLHKRKAFRQDNV